MAKILLKVYKVNEKEAIIKDFETVSNTFEIYYKNSDIRSGLISLTSETNLKFIEITINLDSDNKVVSIPFIVALYNYSFIHFYFSKCITMNEKGSYRPIVQIGDILDF